jgi:hypothetical protein
MAFGNNSSGTRKKNVPNLVGLSQTVADTTITSEDFRKRNSYLNPIK